VVVDAINRLLKAENIKTRYAVASVAGEAVIIKKIKVPFMTEAELAQNINQEAEQYIPFDIDDVALDFQILGRGGLQEDEEEEDEGKMEILLVAVQREIIDNRTDILRDANLSPVIIDLDVFAVANALSISGNLESMGSVALIDLGASFTHVNVMQNGQVGFTQDIPRGGISCTMKLMEEFGMEYEEVEKIKHGDVGEGIDKDRLVQIITESYEEIINEVQQSFEFYSSTSNTQVDHVYLAGGGALTPGIDGLMGQKLNLPVEVMNPLDSIRISARKFDRNLVATMGPLASVAVGLATRKFDYK